MATEAPSTTPRQRRRTAEDGRIVTNVDTCFGRYICEQADELGLTPATVARMLLIEAITKHRGVSKTSLEEKYGLQPTAAA